MEHILESGEKSQKCCKELNKKKRLEKSENPNLIFVVVQNLQKYLQNL